MRPLASLVLALALAAAPAAGAGAGPDGGTLTFEFENDRVAETDRHFTHGMFLSWTSARDDVPGWARRAMDAVPLFPGDAGRRVGYTLGQSIFTPDDVRTSEVVKDDRPYAGWLYAGTSLMAETPERLQRLSLQLGVIGPESGAEQVQKEFHERIKVTIPEGWDNQLDTEPGLLLAYESRWRRLLDAGLGGLDFEVGPHLALAAGNVLTYAGVGGQVRFGEDLADDFGPPRILPGVPGAGFFEPSDGFAWNLFAGMAMRAVARNVFLDGNTFSDSHSVDKLPVVVDLQVGAALRVYGVRLTFTHVFRTREFEEQDEADAFGAVSLSVRF